MIPVLICSPIRACGEALADCLNRTSDVVIVGVVDNSHQMLERAQQYLPRVVIIANGFSENLLEILNVMECMPDVEVVALGIDDPERCLLACAKVGICSFASKSTSLSELNDLIKRAVQGDFVCPPHIAKGLVKSMVRLSNDQYAHSRSPVNLTRRECEILLLVERGFSNKEISRELCLSLSTVKSHVHAVLDKLQVRRRGEAAACARNVLPQSN